MDMNEDSKMSVCPEQADNQFGICMDTTSNQNISGLTVDTPELKNQSDFPVESLNPKQEELSCDGSEMDISRLACFSDGYKDVVTDISILSNANRNCEIPTCKSSVMLHPKEDEITVGNTGHAMEGSQEKSTTVSSCSREPLDEIQNNAIIHKKGLVFPSTAVNDSVEEDDKSTVPLNIQVESNLGPKIVLSNVVGSTETEFAVVAAQGKDVHLEWQNEFLETPQKNPSNNEEVSAVLSNGTHQEIEEATNVPMKSDPNNLVGNFIIPPEMLPNDNSLSMHRGAVVPYSDTEDSGSSSSSSDDDSSDESSESESESSSDSNNGLAESINREKLISSAKPIKVQGEIDIDDLPPIQDLHISVRNEEASEIGKILHAVDTLVVVESYKNLPPLDIDCVLFLDRGARPLGCIFDVLGPVSEPLYCVRFNSEEHIKEQNIQPGMLVYYAPQTKHTKFVFLQHLLAMKGSDASWREDWEAPLSQIDFSDDEEEAKLKKAQRNKIAEKSRGSDEPKTKVWKKDGHLFPCSSQSSVEQSCSQNIRRGGSVYKPRNPWAWSGSSSHFSGNQTGHNVFPYKQEETCGSRGSVRPSSFGAESLPQYHSHAPPRYPEANWSRYTTTSHFGQLPPHSSYHQWSPRCPTPQNLPPHHQNFQYCNPGPSPSLQRPSHTTSVFPNRENGGPFWNRNYRPSSALPSHVHSHPTGNRGPSFGTDSSRLNAEDQRYQAFQSEIARLVDAYNMGAETPSDLRSPNFNPN